MNRYAVVLVAIALSCGARVFAWGANENASAEDLIRRAIEMRKTGDDQGAQPLFRDAYEATHAPRAAAQLGFCEQALGRWADAETHLGESLRSANDPWVKKNRGAIEQALVLIKSHIARIEISGEPTGADVIVNGNVVGQLPIAMPIRVPGGEIEIELRAPGYGTTTKRLRLDGGQYQKISLRAQKEAGPPRPSSAGSASVATATASASADAPATSSPPRASGTAALVPLPGPAAPSPVTGDPGAAPASGSLDGDGSRGSGPGRRSLKFVSWGLAVGAAGIGVYGVLHNFSVVKEFDSGCFKNDAGAPQVGPDAPAGFTIQRCTDLKSRYESAAKLGVAGFVGAAVFGGLGLALWLTESPNREPRTALWRCLPGLTVRGEPSIGCVGRF